MRRATLRMTLESSTTRQVFMTGPFRWLHSLGALCPCRRRASCCDRFGRRTEHLIDVEHDHEVCLESVYADRDACELGVEIDRIGLAFGVGELDHLADRVDEQAVGLAAPIYGDRHRWRGARGGGRRQGA